MYLGELQSKDVVSITDGRNLGRIVDVEINDEGVITSILIEKEKLVERVKDLTKDLNDANLTNQRQQRRLGSPNKNYTNYIIAMW